MADVRQPVVGAHHDVPRPHSSGAAAPTGLHGHAGHLHVPRIHGRAATTAAIVPAGRTCSFSRLDILEWRRLGPTIARQLLQDHDASAASCLGPGLGHRL
jgi:hypothetical protein